MDALTWHGFKVERRGKAARLIVATPPRGQVLAIVAIVGGAFGIDYLDTGRTFSPLESWQVWAIFGAVALVALYYGIFHRVFITFKGDSLTVVRSPIPLPSSYQVKLADIREIDTHVKVITHQDKHGNEHESYRFTVQLSLISDWRPRRLYRTRSEPAAVLFRQTLSMMLANARAMNQG